MVFAIVLAWAIRGFRSGTIPQLFSLAGLLVGLFVVLYVEQWVGAHWKGARPAVVFWALRWMIALLAGGAVAAWLQWWGESLGRSIREGPLGWLDGLGGALVGTTFGLLFSLTCIVVAMRLHAGREVTASVAHARSALPLVRVATRAVSAEQRWLPGHRWLRHQLEAAELGIRSRRTS